MPKYLLPLLFVFCTLIVAQAQDKDRINKLVKQLEDSQVDTLRVTILDQLWSLTAYSDPSSAVQYAQEAIDVSKQIGFAKGEARGYQRLGIAYSNDAEYTKSNAAYRTALEFYKKDADTYRMGLMYYNIAINFKDQSNYDSTLYYNRIAEKQFIAADDSLQIANTIGLKGSVYYEKGQLLLALQYTLEEARLFKQLKDTLRYTDATRTIANIQLSNGDLKQAITNFHECIRLYKRYNDNYFLSITYRDLGLAYLQGQPIRSDSAAYYLEKSIVLANENSMDYQEAAALAFLGELLIKQEKLSDAETALNRSLQISRRINNNLSASSALLDLSIVYRKQGNYNKALTFAKDGLKLASEKGLNDNINAAFRNLYEIYKAKSDTKNALYFFEKYKQSGDSLYNIKQANTINELQIIHETERKETAIALQEEEINTLNARAENDQLTKALYGTGMLAFLIIAGLLYFGFTQRIKKNKIEREKQEAILNQELAFKRKELTTQTLHLVQKNTFIQEIKDGLEKINASPDKSVTELRRLVMLLKKQNAEEQDWEMFKSYFTEVHNDFDTKIKAITNEVTEKEIRLASFLRMNLNTKEIASMLNVMPDSVTKSKYRLKKKLALTKDDDLTQFLNML